MLVFRSSPFETENKIKIIGFKLEHILECCFQAKLNSKVDTTSI